MTTSELFCHRHYQEFSKSYLEHLMKFGHVDNSDTYYLPVSSMVSRDVNFRPVKGQEAIRVLLARSNAKVALLKANGLKLVAESRPIDGGRAQLLAFTELKANSEYILKYEISEKPGQSDGAAAEYCEHFIMAVKTWDSD